MEQLARSQLDGDAVQEETTHRERVARRAEKYRKLAEERLDLVRRAEQREAAANAAAAKCKRQAEASAAAADATQNQLKLVRVPPLRCRTHMLSPVRTRLAAELGVTRRRGDRGGWCAPCTAPCPPLDYLR